jgi:hypothetical protein
MPWDSGPVAMFYRRDFYEAVAWTRPQSRHGTISSLQARKSGRQTLMS